MIGEGAPSSRRSAPSPSGYDLQHLWLGFEPLAGTFQFPSEEETDLSKLITTTLFYG